LVFPRPSVKKKHISEYIANKIADNISDFVYGENRSNRNITKHTYH